MTKSNGFKTEQQFQAACVMLFDQLIPEDRGMLYCNNNNSWNRIEGNKAKAMGVKPGVSDLSWVRWDGKIVFIELKQPGNTQSDDQKLFQQNVEKRGHVYILFYYIEDFKNFICSITGKKLQAGQ